MQEHAPFVARFKNLVSSLRILITTYVVGGLGLNLHSACSLGILIELMMNTPLELHLAEDIVGHVDPKDPKYTLTGSSNDSSGPNYSFAVHFFTFLIFVTDTFLCVFSCFIYFYFSQSFLSFSFYALFSCLLKTTGRSN